jgi:CheY-like chemotaxis protein
MMGGAPAGARAALGWIDMAKELYGLKILVVDDDKDTLELLEWVLRRAGAEVTPVSSAKAAMEAIARERPHILVSDIAMPEEDGLSLMRRIRALPKERGGRIPAVALTAHSLVQDRLQSLRAGFQSHVPKPVVPEELVEVVTSIVHLRSSHED